MKVLSKNKLTAIDPVCGLEVDPAKAKILEAIRGHAYHFCTEKCRDEFKKDPLKYGDILNFTKKSKGWWGRYLDRVQKATNGKPPKCCQ